MNWNLIANRRRTKLNVEPPPHRPHNHSQCDVNWRIDDDDAHREGGDDDCDDDDAVDCNNCWWYRWLECCHAAYSQICPGNSDDCWCNCDSNSCHVIPWRQWTAFPLYPDVILVVPLQKKHEKYFKNQIQTQFISCTYTQSQRDYSGAWWLRQYPQSADRYYAPPKIRGASLMQQQQLIKHVEHLRWRLVHAYHNCLLLQLRISLEHLHQRYGRVTVQTRSRLLWMLKFNINLIFKIKISILMDMPNGYVSILMKC